MLRDPRRKRAQFVKDPYKFTKYLLGGERSGTGNPTIKGEIAEHLEETQRNYKEDASWRVP